MGELSSAWAQQLDRFIEARAPLLFSVRRHLHAYPEPSGEERETSQYLNGVLSEHGLAARLGPDDRGVLVDPPRAEAGPRIALRADIDALRIQEARQSEYSSRRKGVMHACGHDGHTATVLGAILGLADAAEAGVLPWPVPWRAVFQPAEETGEGALAMIGAGALEAVEAILSVHMDPSRAAGRIGVRAGALTAAIDDLEIRIEGRGGHAARPHESLDPIAAAAQLISTLYLFIPRGTDSHDPIVVTIGQVLAGDNPNVIPGEAVLRGTLRSLRGESRERTKHHIRQLARGIAEASSTRIEVEFDEGPGSVENDPALTELLAGAAADFLGPDAVDRIERPSMGGEDFAYYLGHVPGAMFRLGCAASPAGGPPLHSPEFDLDERALVTGARILARAAVVWSNPERHPTWRQP